MTPLERSRFVSERANEDHPMMLNSAGQSAAAIRDSIQSHHGWTTGIGDCCGDFKTCCAVMVCEATVMGQLVERIYRRKYSCVIITALLWLGAIGNLISFWYIPPCEKVYDGNKDGILTAEELLKDLDSNGDGVITGSEMQTKAQPYSDCVDVYYSSWPFILASTFGSLFVVAMWLLTCIVRMKVRVRDSIPATVCSGCDDCLCALFCPMCVQCQLMRHEGLSSDNYELLSPDGERPFGSQTADRPYDEESML